MNTQKTNGSIRTQNHYFKRSKIAENSSLMKKENLINLEETNLIPRNQMILKGLSKVTTKTTSNSPLKKVLLVKKILLKALSIRQMRLLTMG